MNTLMMKIFFFYSVNVLEIKFIFVLQTLRPNNQNHEIVYLVGILEYCLLFSKLS